MALARAFSVTLVGLEGHVVEVEADLAQVPADLWQWWGRLQDRGLDLVVQPAEGRRKSVLLADMDSTMVEQECIDELAAHAGVGEEVAAITAAAAS